MGKTVRYQVARIPFDVRFDDSCDFHKLLPSFTPFVMIEDDTVPVFSLTIDSSLEFPEGREIGKFDSGDSCHEVYHLSDGGYAIVISDVAHRRCCDLVVNADFSQGRVRLTDDTRLQSFGLNNTLMLMYAFSTADKNTLLMHASVVTYHGKGYMFLGESGTGKSTHTANWLRYIPDTALLNDDNPVVRFVDGQTRVFGSPWSGKTPCYKNEEALVGGFVQLKQAPYNIIRCTTPVEAFAYLLPSCSVMKWDKRVYLGICDTLKYVMESTPTYFLENLPDEAAVRMSFNQLVHGSH